ncbi:hypothetical protein EDB87DRAFT_1609879 [Lactarius vividus]|nr:hypothetical protein EDB87DRAFT_1609879 [Lactarius vividus]
MSAPFLVCQVVVVTSDIPTPCRFFHWTRRVHYNNPVVQRYTATRMLIPGDSKCRWNALDKYVTKRNAVLCYRNCRKRGLRYPLCWYLQAFVVNASIV